MALSAHGQFLVPRISDTHVSWKIDIQHKMKIVFILNAIHMQRCVKRIDEFADNGYEIEAYGFDRGIIVKKYPQSCCVNIIGQIDNSKSYLARLYTMLNGIRKVLNTTSEKDTLYYIFGLDNVLFFKLLSSRKYIYEESDLVHTYIKSKIAVDLFEWLDKRAIKGSFYSVFTSDGFVKYHFGKIHPENTTVIANKLPPIVTQKTFVRSKCLDINKIDIGFVGYIRFHTIYNFAYVFCKYFPNHRFHFFGTTEDEYNRNMFNGLNQFPNCVFHGAFKHPDDLSNIYSQIDLVLSTYDVENDNVRYAEPNKIYESIYYETPIIVSSATYLAEKVEQLGIGYSIDATNEEMIVDFVNKLTIAEIKEKVSNIQRIDKYTTLNINQDFFMRLNKKIEDEKIVSDF